VADAKWWTFWEKTGVGLLGLGAILAAVSAETRVAAIVVGGVGFLILIVGLTGQLRAGKMGGEVVPSPTRLRGVGESDPPAAEATTPATEADTKFLAGPRGKLPIYFYGPTSWFPWSGAVQTDVTLRVAVALPGVLEMRGASVGVTRLHGEPREHLIEGALNLSSLTTWLRAQREVWHWGEEETSWEAYGSGYPEFTEYRFAPSWPRLVGAYVPFSARVGVLTGWQVTSHDGVGSDPAIQIACDLALNLLELDSERRQGPIRHMTTPAPIPAALSLTEVAEFLLHLWPITDVAAGLAPELLPPGNYGHGQVAAWIQVRNVQLERVIDLRSLKRLPESSDAPDGSTAGLWPLVTAKGHSDPRDLIADMLADSEPFRTPVPIESVHRFRRFRTPGEETLLAAGAR
jgi:hypothetical protein